MTSAVRQLRISVVHSFYSERQSSGENRVVDMQIGALRSAGHEVQLVARRTSDLDSRRDYVARAALRVATGRGHSPLAAVRAFAPDVVHVHNLFPNFGRFWCEQLSAPLVATMHNYRPLCAAGTLYRDGGVCTNCMEIGHSLPAMKHKCYRQSRIQTLPLAISTRFGEDPVLRNAVRILTLSERMSDLYNAAGVPSAKLRVVNNFVPAPSNQGSLTARRHWIYVGRLTQEKGVRDLILRWPDSHKLVVIGSGPELPGLRSLGRTSVQFLGEQPPTIVEALLAGAIGLVFPSRWLEGMALVCLEALAMGVPILAWPGTPAADKVAELGVGAIAHKRDLLNSLESAATAFPRLANKCREVFKANYSLEAWLAAQHRIYSESISEWSSNPATS